MSTADLVLQFLYPESSNADMRTFRVVQLPDETTSESEELYKFHHPNTGTTTGVTSIQRKNLTTQRWENAGQIEWTSNTNATVYFGIERVSMRELRRLKKSSSRSRRFKASGTEYKWKIADNEIDMICVSTRGKVVAAWSHELNILRVTDRADGILDRVVVTCFLNLWMKTLRLW
ncbi:hypothetical protein WOLCODRAFT_131910 [Wolfiporia cocos MD-104 SS10]|uniref:DUF6593 domain-containing protein n=1 Tax=Wolfiporia cocos (strain MD-104) TaxID=742152 RepID=A0A2H3JGY1_WOLCO|nr:hypothetical protein WOLCODRAFT_131910 [Wolfiporia cocos MD-104 SS10]